MTEEEQDRQDYRGVCKRCFLYAQKAIGEEIPANMIDYYKGFYRIVLEEFLLSLIRLPEVYHIAISGLELMCSKIVRIIEQAYIEIDSRFFSDLAVLKKSHV